MASTSSPEPNDELTTAVGQYVLGEISLGRAAEITGISRWEFEVILEDAGFSALYGPRTGEQLADKIDAARNHDA